MAVEIEQGRWNGVPVVFRKGRVIVRLKDVVSLVDANGEVERLATTFAGADPNDARAAVTAQVDRWALVQASPQFRLTDVAQQIRTDPVVQWAEPDVLVEAFQTPPASPLPVESWASSRIRLKAAHVVENGKDTVLLGIADAGIRVVPNAASVSGVSVQHSSLSPARFLLGSDYVDAHPTPDETQTTHGTGIAGILASQTVTSWLQDDAGHPITFWGMNQKSHVYVCRVLDDGLAPSTGGQADVYLAVAEILAEARLRRARCVINLSLGFGTDLTASVQTGELNNLREMCELAKDMGAILVCAAGNGGLQLDPSIRYPAKFAGQHAYANTVVAVGATTIKRDDFHDKNAVPLQEVEWILNTSSFGRELTVVAPGGQIPTLAGNNGFESQSGTSFAAPFVTGLVSLMWSRKPTLDPSKVIELVRACAWRPPGVVPDDHWGAGRIDAHKAISAI